MFYVLRLTSRTARCKAALHFVHTVHLHGAHALTGHRFHQIQKIAVGRACNQNGGATYTKESPVTKIYCKIRIGNPSKRREDGVKEVAVRLVAVQAWKTKAKDRESWRQRIEKAKARHGL